MAAIAHVLTFPATRRHLARVWPRWRVSVVALAAFVAADLAFGYLRSLADDTGVPWQRSEVVASERALGLGMTPTERLQGWLFHGQVGAVDWLATVVYTSWFIVPSLLTLYVIFFRRDLIASYALARYGLAAAALIVFYAMPTEPPWMALGVPRLLDLVRTPVKLDNNPVAAFPSLHVALPMTQALWLREKGLKQPARAMGVLAGAIGAAVVYTGEHYALDVLAGAALAWAVVRAGRAVERRAAARFG